MVVWVWKGYKNNDSHNTGPDAFQMTKNNVMAIILNAFHWKKEVNSKVCKKYGIHLENENRFSRKSITNQTFSRVWKN